MKEGVYSEVAVRAEKIFMQNQKGYIWLFASKVTTALKGLGFSLKLKVYIFLQRASSHVIQ